MHFENAHVDSASDDVFDLRGVSLDTHEFACTGPEIIQHQKFLEFVRVLQGKNVLPPELSEPEAVRCLLVDQDYRAGALQAWYSTNVLLRPWKKSPGENDDDLGRVGRHVEQQLQEYGKRLLIKESLRERFSQEEIVLPSLLLSDCHGYTAQFGNRPSIPDHSSYRALIRAGHTCVGHLWDFTEEDFAKLRGIGPVKAKRLAEWLSALKASV